VHAVVAEIFAHGAAGERRDVLHRRRIGGGGATMIEYSSAPCSSSTLTNWATVERFWPIAT